VILVSGAAGKTGKAVIDALVKRGEMVRVLAYRPDHVRSLRQLGAHDVVVGDMRHADTWTAAAQGTRAIYHISPNMSPYEVEIGERALRGASDAGTRHFVYHSVLHPQSEAMPHHWQKLRVEERILESRIPFTILQPAAYMQNVLAGWDVIVKDGVYRVPYAADTRLSMVDLGDVAEVAAIVLTQPGHEDATYELCGSETLSQLEVAEALAQTLDRPVCAEGIPLDEWEQSGRARGLGDYEIETLLAMFRYYEQYGLCGNANVLGWLLGRAPRSLASLLSRIQVSSQPATIGETPAQAD
jgi:uncharacterized protein YbjT (DUF2867 family)